MPAIGSGAAGAGIVKPGIYLPNGWNTNWLAARANSASQLAEVAIFGDSTTYGSCTGPGIISVYTWINKLRALSAAAGYPDAGPGMVYADSGDSYNYDGMTYMVSRTGFVASIQPFAVTAGCSHSLTTNDEITFQGPGNICRIFYTKQPETGSFSYSIDGGAPVTVNANDNSAHTGDVITITGLSAGTHTCKIKNLGGGSANACLIQVGFLKSTGVLYNKYGTVGASTATLFSGANANIGSFGAQLMFGITPGTAGSANTYDWGMGKLGSSYPHPCMAISVLGINNLQGLTVASEGNPTSAEQDAANRVAAKMVNELMHFVRLSRSAGADPVIVVPHLDLAINTHTFGGQFQKGIWDAGIAMGCAVIDFNRVVQPVATMVSRGLGNPGVHAQVPCYDAEATFLWQNALSL